LLQIERRVALCHVAADLALLAHFLHQVLALLDRVLLSDRSRNAERNGRHGRDCEYGTDHDVPLLIGRRARPNRIDSRMVMRPMIDTSLSTRIMDNQVPSKNHETV